MVAKLQGQFHPPVLTLGQTCVTNGGVGPGRAAPCLVQAYGALSSSTLEEKPCLSGKLRKQPDTRLYGPRLNITHKWYLLVLKKAQNI